jgi:hypothetical protein
MWFRRPDTRSGGRHCRRGDHLWPPRAHKRRPPRPKCRDGGSDLIQFFGEHGIGDDQEDFNELGVGQSLTARAPVKRTWNSPISTIRHLVAAPPVDIVFGGLLIGIVVGGNCLPAPGRG